MDKKRLREEMLVKRNGLSEDERRSLSEQIAEYIINRPLYEEFHHHF